MAKAATKTLSFPASGSPDVVSYKLYVEESPTEVTYDSQSYDLGNNTSVELGSIAEFDGTYNLGVVAVDDAGNESDMSLASDIPLDLVAPEAPGALSIS